MTDAEQDYLEHIQDASLLIPEGVMEDLEKSFLWRPSHTPGDPYTTAYHEGQRSLVIHLRQLQALARSRRDRRLES